MLAVITDTHVGARGGSTIFREYFRWWYEHQFFNVLAEKGVTEILHLGDFFDNRNAVSSQDIDFVCKWFANQLMTRNLQFTITLGNHDVAFKNTNRIHSLSMLKAAAPKNVTVIEETTIKVYGEQTFVLVPWINAENYSDTFKKINDVQNKSDVIVAGHFEFAGAKHYLRSAPAEHGLDASLFSEFKEVWSGHFHHKSQMSNIFYLGSSFHLTWMDYNDKRGYHLFDNDGLHYVENDYCLFLEVLYKKETFSKMTDQEALDKFESRFIRLIVDDEYNHVDLMKAVALINRCKPHDLQIINNMMVNKNEYIADNTKTDVAKSTVEYIDDYIKNAGDDFDTTEVKQIMSSLYKRALSNQVSL